MKNSLLALLTGIILLHGSPLFAQDSLNRRVTTMEEIFRLALANSTQLKVVEKYTELARQQTEVNKLYRLPSISTDLNYGYISNADIWTPSFSEHQKGAIPHQFTEFTVMAGQIIFKGNAVNNTIQKSALEEQVAQLNLEKNTTDIKFLVAAKYLDIYRLINQVQVFESNLKLAQNRLKNILTMQKQGMVTQNDVLRTELTISDLILNIKKTNNTIEIYNKQLNMVTGLPDSVRLVPDTTLLKAEKSKEGLAHFMDEAYKENHELKIAATENKIAETDVRLLGSDRYPEISLFTGSNLQRPFYYTLPGVDIFYNIWQAGIGIKYNISSIYQSPRKIKAARIKLEQSKQNETLQRQDLEVSVSSYYIKYNEARDELATYQSDLKSAEENYRIVEKKYFNQLALLTDMLDASSTKIEAELKVNNASINVIYTWYQLLKSIGTI
jgi:outer membrane protein